MGAVEEGPGRVGNCDEGGGAIPPIPPIPIPTGEPPATLSLRTLGATDGGGCLGGVVGRLWVGGGERGAMPADRMGEMGE